MKKIIILGMLVGALLATSCQKDDNIAAGKESTVTFVLESPAMVTRAYSDGKTVDRLTYAVYEKGKTEAFREGTIENAFDDNLSATVNLTLVSGKSYDVVFWADKTGSPYTFDETTKSISIDYDGTDAAAATDDVKCNDETLDAFFGSAEITHLTGETNTKEVTLTRPFAQLNIGATDYTTAAFNATSLSVTVPVYTTLNLLTGEVNGTSSNVTFTATNLAGTTENQLTFPVENVADYLTMSYLLVPADQELVQVEFSATNADNTTRAHTFANIPVQRNYRTNIYGKLFESEMTYTVKLNPEYKGDNNENNDLDYQQVPNATEGVKFDEGTQTYGISNAESLEWLKTNVLNESSTQYVAKTISIALLDNIDMSGKTWSLLEAGNVVTGITLDGNGYTISNWDTANQALFAPKSQAGFTFRNLTLSGCDVKPSASSHTALFVGYRDTHNVPLVFEKCSIIGCVVENEQGEDCYVGAFMGWNYSGSSYINITDCSLIDTSLKGYKSTGGFIGQVGFQTNVVNAIVKNCNISNTENGGSANKSGCIVGTIQYNNSAFDTTITTSEISGNNVQSVENSTVVIGRKINDGNNVTVNGVKVPTGSDYNSKPINSDGTVVE